MTRFPRPCRFPPNEAICVLLIWFLSLLLSYPLTSIAQDDIREPVNLHIEAFDIPGDDGSSISLHWIIRGRGVSSRGYDISFAARVEAVAKLLRSQEFPEVPGSVYRVLVSDPETGRFRPIAELPANKHYETDIPGPWWVWGEKRKDVHFFQVKSSTDLPLINGNPYLFQIVLTDGQYSLESRVVLVTPQANLFNWSKLNNLILMLAFGGVVLFSIRRARSNPNIFLRRIPGLDAVEEAVGRATEMGNPSNLSTIASTIILGEVAKRVAAYGSELKVPHRAAIVMAICQEIVHESYLLAGRPDAYRDDTNFFITRDQFAYTAAVDGIMLREKPAANFFMGYYYAESLLLAETGTATGAIQIAGTDAEAQLPFFIASCDYTLIGEELYAASAYLSREPALVGALRGQDLGKGVLLGVLLLGTALITIGDLFQIPIVRTILQLFSDFK